ncbi:MAG TPA: penicillin-binding transpeptidase domain-containing protein [Frankiaceae bacterium]|nr:penicillin-binding transpeptidase domain-containing protein [Frankiaceae bacterium]
MSDTDSRTDLVEREKSHWVRITILALIPILIVAGAGVFVLTRHHKADHRQQEAQTALSAYLASWSRANYAGMAAHANVPAAAIAAVDGPLRRNLVVTAATYTPGLLTRDKTGDRATAPYTARLTLSGLGAWSYSGSLTLVKTQDSAKQDVWRVQFTPAAIQPQLTATRVFERTHVSATRGQLLDAEGLPLRGADGDLDANLLGTVGPLSVAQAKAAGPGFSAGDIAGQTGIERVYNTALAGDPGGAIVLMQGAIRLQTLKTYPAVAGHNVTTTIDLRVQRAGESALAPVGLPAAIVAIDTNTGGVLATVDHPLGGFARAIRGQYPPGSTFKVVTTTAALLAGRTETTPLNCPPTVSVEGNVFKNASNESFGELDLIKAFAVSCNTAFVNLRESMTEADMKRAALLYGFDETQPLPIQSYGGSYPVPLNNVVAAAAAFGQGQVQTSPLQMATVAAAVAGGVWRKPFVAGKSTEVHPIPPLVDLALKQMMRAVVTSGTADVLQFPGIVYGKTGTAEYGSGKNPPTHAWFIGWRGTVAFAVIVEGGGFGASVAAPIAANFLSALGPA